MTSGMDKIIKCINDLFLEKRMELVHFGVDKQILDKVFGKDQNDLDDEPIISVPKRRIPVCSNKVGKWDIGDVTLKSREEAQKYTRARVNSTGYCKVKNHHKNFQFFQDLIGKHSEKDEKIGCGIDYFELCPNGSYPIMYLIRLNGTKDNFSYSNCATGKKSENKLNRAMRDYIDDQILEFRSQSIMRCCNCKKIGGKFHVDHNKPPFCQLSRNFLKINRLPEPTAFDEVKGRKKFMEKDERFAKSWWTYHKINATLQILCVNCNMKKGGK